jgi:uncharacterized membrane-anchored protein
MSRQRLNDLVLAAAARGILQPDATAQPMTRPWPIVLMTGLGAWLAVIPFVAVLFLTLGDQLEKGALGYVVGAVILGVALMVLRSGSRSEFIEQLGFPALLVAGVLLAIGLYRDLPPGSASAVLMLVIIGAAWAAPQIWLRTLLGALAGAAFAAMVAGYRTFEHAQLPNGLHCALLVWLVAVSWSDSRPVSGVNARGAIALDAIASGWAAMLLLGLAYSSGKTFMIGALLEPLPGDSLGLTRDPLSRTFSIVLAGSGAAWLAHRWPACRAPHILLAVALLLVLSWVMPLLGGALLILAICTTSARPLLAVAAAVSAAWIIGGFYYQLNMPLASKALIMVAVGAAFGLIGWLNWPRRASAPAQTPARPPRLMALSLLVILVVINGGIWQKENLIRHGRPVFIELAPVDPRSLMQGDYMRLNFHLPHLGDADRRTKVVAKIDSRGVAVIQQAASGAPLAPDEILIELVNTGSGLRPASDAWYFKEGEGKRWQQARYGEFRIDGNGRALLVNLRGADLEAL